MREAQAWGDARMHGDAGGPPPILRPYPQLSQERFAKLETGLGREAQARQSPSSLRS